MEKKVVLVGESGSGKSSMISMIFGTSHAEDTKKLSPTDGVKHCNVELFDNLKFNILDCGGQTNSYFKEQRKEIFSNVNILIYVFDITTLDDSNMNTVYFYKCMNSIIDLSSFVKVYCLLNKMDLIRGDSSKKKILNLQNEIDDMSRLYRINIFKTTIYNRTLYEAWSSIVKPSIPNIEIFDRNLRMFFDLTGCEEVALFEESTILLMFTSGHSTDSNVNIFEKGFNILMAFKSNCNSAIIKFKGIEINYPTYRLFIEKFTKHTYIMVVVKDSEITSNTILSNIKTSRQNLEKLLSQIANYESKSSTDS